MKYKAVVFDMDGVIFDSEREVLNCWITLAKKYGIEDIEKNFLLCTGTNHAKTTQIMYDAYGPDFPYEEFAHEASKMFHEKNDGGRLPKKPGVEELLQFLKDSGIKIALASSTRRESVVRELTEAGIIDFFEVIVSGDMVTRSKPAPDIFLKACEELGVEPREALAIEDSYNGIRSANAGGLHPIMVPDLLPADEEMKRLAEKVLKDLTEVKDYIYSMEAKMQEVYEFIKECGCYYLATVDEDQPRVRPFGTIDLFEGKLYIQTGKKKDVSKQIQANPKAELCCFKDGKWLRLAGSLVRDDRREAKKHMLDAYPNLRGMYSEDDDNTEVLYFSNATATFSSFTEAPKVIEI